MAAMPSKKPAPCRRRSRFGKNVAAMRVGAGITQEQLNGMLQALDGPQKLQMVELFQAVYAEKEKEDKEREAAQASKPGNDHEPDLDKRH